MRLDETRVRDIDEAWTPVSTPDGPGVLWWPTRTETPPGAPAGRGARCAAKARGRSPGRAGQPPATAGMMEIWVPAGVGVSRPSANRTSSSPT
ncbi:DUF6210 family protein [Thermomonospora catenispora]|uniref:DUF6210 family protein n=1 Tax=Thermomonospora catenispora TaxID=2493090 RepID=UPI003BAB1F93